MKRIFLVAAFLFFGGAYALAEDYDPNGQREQAQKEIRGDYVDVDGTVYKDTLGVDDKGYFIDTLKGKKYGKEAIDTIGYDLGAGYATALALMTAYQSLWQISKIKMTISVKEEDKTDNYVYTVQTNGEDTSVSITVPKIKTLAITGDPTQGYGIERGTEKATGSIKIQPDNASIVWDGEGAAAKLAISGYNDAQQGYVATKSAGGIAWKKNTGFTDYGYQIEGDTYTLSTNEEYRANKSFTLPRVSVDNVTIVSNANGELQFKGWPENGKKLVFKNASGALDYQNVAHFVDNHSLYADMTKDDGTIRMYGFDNAVNQQIPYKNNGVLGWKELPNITTNYVVGDAHSIQTVATSATEKVISLYHWEQAHSDYPLALVKTGDYLSYLPYAQPYERMPDNKSIDYYATNKIEIAGWATNIVCQKSLDDIVWYGIGHGNGAHDFVTRRNDGELHYVATGGGIANSVTNVADRVVNNFWTNVTCAGTITATSPLAGGTMAEFLPGGGFQLQGSYVFSGWSLKDESRLSGWAHDEGEVPYIGMTVTPAPSPTDPNPASYQAVNYTNIFLMAKDTLRAATNAIPPIVEAKMEDYVPYELVKDDPINCNNHSFQVNANFATWFAINPGNSSAQINGTYVYIGTNTYFSGSVSLPPATSVNGESLTNIAAQAAAAVKSEDNSVTGIRVEDQGGTKYLIINNGGMQYKVALENL